MKRSLSFALAAAFAAAPAFAAETYVADKTHSNVLFTIRHFVSNVTGKFDDYSLTIHADRAKPESSSVEFTIKAASINTGDAKRDGHLRSPDFFDVEKHPEITFKSARIKATGKDTYDVTGILTMHGVSKEVTVKVTHLGFIKDPWGNERAGFQVEATLNRKDFGIVWNQTLDTGGLMLGEEVKVTINVEAVKQKDAPAAK